MKNRIISLILALSLCASLLVLPAHAYDYNPQPSSGNTLRDAIARLFSEFGFFNFNDYADSLVLPVTGPVNSLEELQAQANVYNDWMSKVIRSAIRAYPDGNASMLTNGWISAPGCPPAVLSPVYPLVLALVRLTLQSFLLSPRTPRALNPPAGPSWTCWLL